MIFFLIFLIIPLIEISLFVTVGDSLGVINTLALCVITALIGSGLVRKQGLDALYKGKQQLDQGQLPLDDMFTGLCLILAGAVLITPGFFTDAIGFALLVPQFRAILRSHAKKHFKVSTFESHQTDFTTQKRRVQDDDIIEGDFERLDDDNP